MTRLFLVAGVAALAISMPAGAKPGGGHGGGRGDSAVQARAGGNVHASGGGGRAAVRAQSRGGGGGAAFRMQSRGGGGGGAFRMSSRGGGGHAFEMRSARSSGAFVQRQNRHAFAVQSRGHGRSAAQVERGQARQFRMMAQRHEQRNVARGGRVERQQNRMVERQQLRGNRFEQNNRQALRGQALRGQAMRNQAVRNEFRGNGAARIQNREAMRNDLRGNRFEQVRNREAFRNELRANRIERLDNGMFVRDQRLGARALRAEDFGNRAQGFGVGGCPPGLASKGCMPPGQAAKLLGTPLSAAARIAALESVPFSARYLYPDTNDYFYRYGEGNLFRVDRDTSLISALLPLAFGGYMPGSYLPNTYMSSYVPSYYGFNSFYPDYGNDCHRYGAGVVYEVDCYTGFVEDVIPLYAGGYGVGQMLPTGYGYYNVPYQYRSMYYDTSDAAYWYAPGAIYQYDPGSSLITSVAALMSPGFAIGQPVPLGYDTYNVPYAYRSTYYDTPTAYYRYNDGYIYQIDPTTQLVTAIVASILT